MLSRYIDDLIRNRRPRRFRPSTADADAVRAAIALRATQSEAPSAEFVADLETRLRTAPAQHRSRRQFVQAASIAAGAAAVGVGVGVGHFTTEGTPSTPAQADQTLVPNSGSWHTVTASMDLDEGSVQPFDLGTVVGFVTRTDGQIRAVSGICTHLGCRLMLDAPAHALRCPCHNAAFSPNGKVLEHQLRVSPRPLPHLLARESDGAVQVYVPNN
jgi:cytochrome b6-f complex iron-sulfur subunit